MEKEFNALRRLAGYSASDAKYLDPESPICFLDYIEHMVAEVMITRVKDFFNQAYKPKYGFEVSAELIKYGKNPFFNTSYDGPQVMVHFSLNEECWSFVVALNSTKRKYVCGTMSQSTDLRMLIRKIEKEAYADAKAAAKAAKSKKKPINVNDIIDFHS